MLSELECIEAQLKQYDLIKVPLYQRSFAWEREHVETFWDDIVESIKDGKDKYFIGPIVTKENDKKTAELIDGQQRLTTALAILSVVRRELYNEYAKNKDENEHLFELVTVLNGKFVVSDSLGPNNKTPRYEMNEENSGVFLRHIKDDSSYDELLADRAVYKRHESNYKLIDAVIVIWDSIKSYMSEGFDQNLLINLATFILERLQILNIRVSDESDAFLIFETINDRGRELDTMDLLKNLLFSRVNGASFERVRNNWIRMMEQLGVLSNYNDFLIQFWTSRHGYFNKSSLFKLIKDDLKGSSQDIINFSDEISSAARDYAAIANPSHEIWKDYCPDTIKNLGTLKMLTAKAIAPILMAAMKEFDKIEFLKLTKYLLVFQVRYILVAEQHTNKYSKALSVIPPLISSREFLKAMKVAKKLDALGIYVNDEEFKKHFLEYISTSSKKAKYLLTQIENYEVDGHRDASTDSKTINLEHIMPQARSSDWSRDYTCVNDDEYESWVNRLGNLCLANKQLNTKVKNTSFNNKKKILFSQMDDIKTTSMIKDFKVWDKSAIDARQRTLSENICDIWGISFNS